MSNLLVLDGVRLTLQCNHLLPTSIMTARDKARSRSGRAGLHFPVARLHRWLRKSGRTNRVAAGAAVFLAAVLEYLASEVLELAGNSARDNGKV